jgi:heptosyltransferase II
VSPLVIQTSFIGDMVLATPLIAELARQGPVDVVATPASAGLLANNPDVRTVVVYDKRGADRGVRGFRRIATRLRAAGAKTAFLAQGSIRSAALAFAAGAQERVGFATSSGRAFYTRLIPYRRDLHHAARLWQLAHPEQVPASEQIRPRLYPGAAEVAAVDALLSAAGVRESDPLVAVAPGSVWATKRWPGYPALVREMGRDIRIVVLGGAEDASLADELIAAASGGAVSAVGRLSLLASAEVIRRSLVLVTNDSAPQHLASAMGTPTITIFGPTVPAFGFGPLAPRSAVVERAGLECRPCDSHGPQVCPLQHWKCMRELAPRDVIDRMRHLMSSPTT